jgi:hypothetical protein
MRFYYYSLHLALEQLKQGGRRELGAAAAAAVGGGPLSEGKKTAASIPEADNEWRAEVQNARGEDAEQSCTWRNSACNTCKGGYPGANGGVCSACDTVGMCSACVAGKYKTISEEAEEEKCVIAVLDAACEYLDVAALLYKSSSDAAQRCPSEDPHAEASWFLSKSLKERPPGVSAVGGGGFVLLEYVSEAGRDLRPRSKTYGAAHPAFAVLINRTRKVLVVAVRGTKVKTDRLIDLEFEYQLLLSEAEAKVATGWQGQVHKGMLKCARFILQTWGLRSLLMLLPADFKIRFVGHSLGAGTAILMLAILKADPTLSSRDLIVHAFGTRTDTIAGMRMPRLVEA